jgi:hypothetical protein
MQPHTDYMCEYGATGRLVITSSCPGARTNPCIQAQQHMLTYCTLAAMTEHPQQHHPKLSTANTNHNPDCQPHHLHHTAHQQHPQAPTTVSSNITQRYHHCRTALPPQYPAAPAPTAAQPQHQHPLRRCPPFGGRSPHEQQRPCGPGPHVTRGGTCSSGTPDSTAEHLADCTSVLQPT